MYKRISLKIRVEFITHQSLAERTELTQLIHKKNVKEKIMYKGKFMLVTLKTKLFLDSHEKEASHYS